MVDKSKKLENDKKPQQAEKLSDIDRIANIIENRKSAKCSEPRGMPTQTMQGAQWWIKFLETRLQHEVDTKTKKGWNLPYQERIADCLKIFYRLRHNEQAELLAMRDRGICWRGDTVEFMRIRAKVDMNKINKSKLTRTMKTIIARAQS